MKKFLNTRLYRVISLILLFFLGALSLYYGVYLAFPYVSFEGRGILTFLPLTLVMFFPMFSFAFRWMFTHFNGAYRKWKVQYYYSIVGGLFMLVATIWHILSISLAFKWQLYGGIFPLFPFDVLVVAIIYLTICILLFVKSVKEQKALNTEENIKLVHKKRSVAFVIIYTGFAAYFYGGFYFFTSLIGDGYFDKDFFFILSIALAFLVMVIGLVMYVLFRHQKLENQRKWYKIGLIVVGSVMLVDAIWIIVGYIVSPYFVPHSVAPMFPFGYAIKMPIGLFMITAWMIPCYIVALVRYFKSK